MFRRGLAPHLKSLMGPWWFSQFDPASEVSQAARLSFEVFPIYLIPMNMLLNYSHFPKKNLTSKLCGDLLIFFGHFLAFSKLLVILK